MIDSGNPEPERLAHLPAAIASEICMARHYLDGLEKLMADYDASGRWSPEKSYEWAALADIQLRDRLPVAEWFEALGHGTAGRLDKLVRAIVAHAYHAGGGFACLASATSTKN